MKNPEGVAERMHALLRELYPELRSITGDGLRRTLQRVALEIPLRTVEVPTGTPVLDWKVPREWRLREAWIAGPNGTRVLDLVDHNLQVLQYSAPVRRRLSLRELDEHLYSLPDQPDLIPYRTSYYRETWGFCLPHRLRVALPEGTYEVCIDSELFEGSLTYAECVLPGEGTEEFLLSCHCCHPSLANDNLSALVVLVELARELARWPRRRFTYRFLFAPGTIGAITWLARNPRSVRRLRLGLVAAGLGHGEPHYKRSRSGRSETDRLVEAVLRQSHPAAEVADFVPFGYDERQYNSPGFDLGVGSLTGTPWGRYAEYHTSADRPDFVDSAVLARFLDLYLQVVRTAERNHRFQNLAPYGEPQLGRRGLYRSLGGDDRGRERELALLWVLNASDGTADLLDIAGRSGLPFDIVAAAADALVEAELIVPVG